MACLSVFEYTQQNIKLTMKKIFYTLFIALLIWGCTTSTQKVNVNKDAKKNSFDSTLAAKLGADEYGMKQYVMAFLKKGPNQDHDSATAVELQRAHMDNIIRMANEEYLILAGPFMDSGELRGIYIFNVRTVEEAKALTETDPAIEAGRLTMELHPWYGSAALMQINEVHSRLSKKSI